MPCIRNLELRLHSRSPFPSSSSSRCPSQSIDTGSLSPSTSVAFETLSNTPPPPPSLVPPASFDIFETNTILSGSNSSSTLSSTGTNNTPKSSHARKRDESHIPRPSNAFILFRSDFVSNQKVPSSIESHSQNLSRIAGQVWRSLSPAEKAPYIQRAREVKEEHYKRFPGYEYHPTNSWSLRGKRKVKKGRGEKEVQEARKKCVVLAELVKRGKEGGELEKALVSDKTSYGNAETDRTRGPMLVDQFDRVEPVMPRFDFDIMDYVSDKAGPYSRSVPVTDANEKSLARKSYPFDGMGVDVSKLQELFLPAPPPSSSDTPSSIQVSGLPQDEDTKDAQESVPMKTRTTSTKRSTAHSSTNTSVVSSVNRSDSPLPASPSAPPLAVLLNLPNTFIPPGHTSPLLPSLGPRLINSDSDNEVETEREKLPLPSMQVPPTPVLHPKTIRADAGTTANLIFPGALHVPNKPRSCSVNSTGGETHPRIRDNVGTSSDTFTITNNLPSKIQSHRSETPDTLRDASLSPSSCRSGVKGRCPSHDRCTRETNDYGALGTRAIPKEISGSSSHSYDETSSRSENASPWILRQARPFPSQQSTSPSLAGRVPVGIGSASTSEVNSLPGSGRESGSERESD